jgi:hypothetical protein
MNKLDEKQPTQEQWIEVLKWCGLEIAEVFASEDYDAGGYIMHSPEFNPTDKSGYYLIPAFKDGNDWLELPLIDLNNLFKYAVPKLWVCNITLEEGIFWIVHAGSPNIGDGEVHSGGAHESLELALFWAIWSVIHAG